MNKKGLALFPIALMVKWIVLLVITLVISSAVGSYFGGHADSNNMAGAIYDKAGDGAKQFYDDAYSSVEKAKERTGSLLGGYFFGGLDLIKNYWYVFLIIVVILFAVTRLIGKTTKMGYLFK